MIPQWPDAEYLTRSEQADALVESFATDQVLRITLTDALQIAAHESREYQSAKERVFTAALQLDLERDSFRRTWSGVLEGLYEARLEREVAIDDKGHTDRQTVGGVVDTEGILGLSQRLRNGITFAGQIGLDLAALLTQDRAFSRGVFADISITIPLPARLRHVCRDRTAHAGRTRYRLRDLRIRALQTASSASISPANTWQCCAN